MSLEQWVRICTSINFSMALTRIKEILINVMSRVPADIGDELREAITLIDTEQNAIDEAIAGLVSNESTLF